MTTDLKTLYGTKADEQKDRLAKLTAFFKEIFVFSVVLLVLLPVFKSI